MNVAQSTVKSRKPLNLIRSAKAPVISAGVMMANIAWKTACACCGMVAA